MSSDQMVLLAVIGLRLGVPLLHVGGTETEVADS